MVLPQCKEMYKKTAKKSVQLQQVESRKLPFWIAEEIKNNSLFVRNVGNTGRLGNKLFEFAGVFGVAKRNKRTPILKQKTCSEVSCYFDTRIVIDDLNEASSNFMLLYESKHYIQMNETINLLQRNVTIGLYLINGQYFSDAEEDLRHELKFKKSILDSAGKFLSQSLLPRLNGTTFVRVVIHVRRSDILSRRRTLIGFKELSSDYFSNSMDYFRQCYDRVQFVVVSDDIDWCKKNIVGPEVIYSEGHNPGEDMALSSLCDHAIITYGTFGMWISWFANGITIRPRNDAMPLSMADQDFQIESVGYPLDAIQI